MDVDALRKKLEPATIRANLLRAGMFLTGWELVKNEIQSKVRDFFLTCGDADNPILKEEYRREVLQRHESLFEASLRWLVDQRALSDAQAERVRELRLHRNEVAHELAKLIIDPAHEVNAELLREMASILRALGVFWGRIEVEINSDDDGVEVRDDDIRSGPSILMDLVVESCEEVAQPVGG